MSDYSDSRIEFIWLLVLLALAGCGLLAWSITAGDDDKPRKAVLDAGYSDPKVGGSRILLNGCAEEEIGWPVEATNVQGQRVSLNVCCGTWLKGCTVRH